MPTLLLAWLEANLATILVGLAVVAILTAVTLHLVRQKKQGKSSCSCGCSGCPMSGSCHGGEGEHSCHTAEK